MKIWQCRKQYMHINGIFFIGKLHSHSRGLEHDLTLYLEHTIIKVH